MKEINLQYPLVPGNFLCDGTWHQIRVNNLWRVANSTGLYLMTYYDRKAEATCVTVLVRSRDGFYKAPFLDYDRLVDILHGLLVRIDPSCLPSNVCAIGVSEDLVDLSLRMLRGDTLAVSGPGAPPPPPPPSGGDNSGGSERMALLVKKDSVLGNPPVLPPCEDQTMYVRTRWYQIATLFIHESIIYASRLTKDGLVIWRLDTRDVLYYLKNYYIVWRGIDYRLIWNDVVILEALNRLMDECARRGKNVEIFEIEATVRRTWTVEDIPEWILRCAHRYNVVEDN